MLSRARRSNPSSAKRSNQAISLGLNPPCFAQAIILTFWAGVRLLFSTRTLARFAYTFFSNPKAHSCRIHVSSERLKRSLGAHALFSPSQALGLLRSSLTSVCRT